MRINGIHKSLALMIISAAALIVIAGCTSRSSLPPYTALDVSYGPDRENTMDVSLPEGRTKATPALILVHGGAWTGGDKKDFAFLRGYFFKRGFAAFSVNYRLARVNGTGIRNILDDMDMIIAFVKMKSDLWTYSSDAVFLAGHSAGGHIAMLYSFGRAPAGTVRGVVSYCGLFDLTDPELQRFLVRMHRRENPHAKKPFDLIGFVTGPGRTMRRACSPQFFPRDIPVLLFCGKRDDIIPWHQSESLHRTMKEHGFDSTLHVYPDMGHDISPYYGEIMETTGRWLNERMRD